MTRALVEGFASDAVALAGHLRAAGLEVRLAGGGAAPPAALALRDRGVRVEPHVDLDADHELPDIAYLDVWTPEVAPRVARLRAGGTRTSCLADLLLHDSPVPVLGVTGTAGKTTTAALLASLLRAAGRDVQAAGAAPSGQLWAAADLLPLVGEAPRPPTGDAGILVLELTSSHLAFCAASPHVALVTGVWPDHVELHGSVEAYVAAKERVVRFQRPGSLVVLDPDDPGSAGIGALAAARGAVAWCFSETRAVERGSFLRAGRLVVRADGVEHEVGVAPGPGGGRRRAALAALAGALAAGVPATALPAAFASALAAFRPPAHRADVVGHLGPIELVDDTMAATATKAAATLGSYPAGSVLAVLGGRRASAGLRVQTSPAELDLLDAALDRIARATQRAVVFGQTGAELAAALGGRGAAVERVSGLHDALDLACELARGSLDPSGGAVPLRALVVAPMFPLRPAERALVARRLRSSR